MDTGPFHLYMRVYADFIISSNANCVIYFWYNSYIKTCGSVSVAKKAAWCTSVLFTRTPVSTFSAYCSLKTFGAISTKFIYAVPRTSNSHALCMILTIWGLISRCHAWFIGSHASHIFLIVKLLTL